jgi:hypothetical protein
MIGTACHAGIAPRRRTQARVDTRGKVVIPIAPLQGQIF